MTSKFSHAQNVLESKTATVTSGGHWFNATRETVKEFVPGLLKKQEYESLVMKAVFFFFFFFFFFLHLPGLLRGFQQDFISFGITIKVPL